MELIFLYILSSAFETWQFVLFVILEHAAEVGRRQLKNKEIGGNADNTLKLQATEQKMGKLASAMAMLSKEAKLPWLLLKHNNNDSQSND